MPLSFDQLAEVRAALAETRRRAPALNLVDPPPHLPPVAPPLAATPSAKIPDDRRHAPRIHERCNAEVSEWIDNRAGSAMGVVIEDISTTGVGIVHTGQLQVGEQYLLQIPRPYQHSLSVLFTVVRCARRDGGMFDVQVTPDEVLSVTTDHSDHLGPHAASTGTALPEPRRSPLRVAMMVLAFAASVIAVFFNLI